LEWEVEEEGTQAIMEAYEFDPTPIKKLAMEQAVKREAAAAGTSAAAWLAVNEATGNA
jgi:hypothetical protein